MTTDSPLQDSVHVIILAAGKGVRMRDKSPKALTILAGVALIDRVIATVNAAFGDAWSIVIGHGAPLMRKHLGKRVHYIAQHVRRGTGHALKVALKDLPRKTPDRIVVITGDHPLLLPATLTELVQKSVTSGAPITVLTVIVPGDFLPDNFFWSFGRVIRADGGTIRRIASLTDASREERAVHEVNTGCYVFETHWLLRNISKLHPANPSGEYDLSELVRVATLSGDRVVASPVQHWHEGISIRTPEDVRFAEDILLNKSIVSH